MELPAQALGGFVVSGWGGIVDTVLLPASMQACRFVNQC